MALPLLLLLACAHPVVPAPAAVAPSPAAEAPAAEAPALAPRPFDAARMYAGIPAGTRIRLTIAVAGQPTVEQRWTFVRTDATSATIASTVHAEDGTLLADEGESTAAWTELEQHASFPAAATTRTDATLECSLGSLDTWLYTVAATSGDGVPQVKRYWFAKAWPGPPVLFTTEQAGAEVFRMTMVEHTTPALSGP